MQAVASSGPAFVPAEQLEAEIRRVCGAFDVAPLGEMVALQGEVATRTFGAFDTAVVTLDSAVVARTPRSIRQDPGEYFFLLIQEEGRSHVQQGETAVDLAPGDMFLVDSVRPSTFRYAGGRSRQTSLHLPRGEIIHRFGSHCAGGLTIMRDDPLWVALRAVMTKIHDTPAMRGTLSEAFLSLIGACLQSMQACAPAPPGETLLSRALVLIDRYGADPDFGPGTIAARLNVSERTLQRHFQPLGETPGHRLLNRRLDLAHRRLTQGLAQKSQAVTAIALDCGFNDLSYFHREFRKKFGMTPKAVAQRS